MSRRTRQHAPVKIEYDNAGAENEETNKVGITAVDVKKEKEEKPENVASSSSKKKTAGGASKKKPLVKEEENDEKIDTKKPKWEPPNWRTILSNIQQMRSAKDAPVDSMGCERTMEENVEPKVRRFQTLLSLMLSSQTKDPVTFAAMQRLKAGVPLTVQKMLDISEAELGQIIIPVGFWKKKSTYIKKTAQILRDEYNDDIPDTVKGLTSLPGVGPKMAYIAMHVAWEQNAGIGVDTHVHRISNRLKWTGPKEAKTPEDTRKALESWLPPEEWQEFNILLVGFGQTICLPINPKCTMCLNKDLCPYGKKEVRGQGSKSKKGKSPKGNKKVKEEKSSTDEDDADEEGTSKYF